MTDGPYRQPAGREPDEPPVDPARPWALQTWVSQRSCPTCALPLFAARKDGFRVDACGSCGGAWLPTADATRMVDERSAVPVELGIIATERAQARRGVPAGKPCLDCGRPLVRRDLPRAQIDACDVHGTWFDAGELRVLARTVLSKLPPATGADVDLEIWRLEDAAERRDKIVVFFSLVALVLGFDPKAGR
jgi:Zn-finger nucleic acid-binding protein